MSKQIVGVIRSYAAPGWFAITLTACPPGPSPVPPFDADAEGPIPQPVVDAAPRPPQDASKPSSVCAQACAQLEWLGCPEGRPTSHQEPCEQVCQDMQDFGNGLSLPTACVIASKSIDEVRKCGKGPSAVKCGSTK